jgi:large subunit ribosomal protein L31
MRPDIHPEYRPVIFEDSSTGDRWLCPSTIRTDRTVEWEDGNTYPHFVVDISNLSHPFYTGKMKIVDTAGRVERFNRRHGARRQAT